MPVEEAVVARMPVLAELAVVAVVRAVAGHPERQIPAVAVAARLTQGHLPVVVVLAS